MKKNDIKTRNSLFYIRKISVNSEETYIETTGSKTFDRSLNSSKNKINMPHFFHENNKEKWSHVTKSVLKPLFLLEKTHDNSDKFIHSIF